MDKIWGLWSTVFFHQENEETLKVSTIVQYKEKMGKNYFTILSLLHKPFMKLSLKNILEAMYGKQYRTKDHFVTSSSILW